LPADEECKTIASNYLREKETFDAFVPAVKGVSIKQNAE